MSATRDRESDYDSTINEKKVTATVSHKLYQLDELDETTKKNAEGLELFEESQEISKDEIDKVGPSLVWKFDSRVSTMIVIVYLIQFLDKLSLNYSAAYSFKEDLGLTGQRYSWVAAIYNFGYLAGALPANYLIQKFPVAKFTAISVFTWAILLLCHCGAYNYGGILVLRFLLGLCEAGISPSCMNLVAAFYTKKEQPLRMCFFLSFNGIATMVGALLAWGLGHATQSSLKPWRLIYLVIGLLNLVSVQTLSSDRSIV
ncbi:unnamed protein product [Ambrosiozyma monospora]|uniref:Unnamed protein product n=1 Tax=Ambrosiozyma monospora TaxID=43982 RepID=A0ACB5U4X8_AMBMO|nr:unnamed protein product [Ambrosiozyma monospora]